MGKCKENKALVTRLTGEIVTEKQERFEAVVKSRLVEIDQLETMTRIAKKDLKKVLDNGPDFV